MQIEHEVRIQEADANLVGDPISSGVILGYQDPARVQVPHCDLTRARLQRETYSPDPAAAHRLTDIHRPPESIP